jgi:hypothetical protein
VSYAGGTVTAVASTLARWLGTHSAEALAALLRRRPEALAPPTPRDLAELASRLQGRSGVLRAYQSLTLPAVQLIEIISGYPCRSRAELAALVGDDGLDGTLATLADRALVWEFDGQLSVAGELTAVTGHPLHLGPGVERLLDRRTAAELRGVAAALGLQVPAQKREVVHELAARFADGDWVRALAATAPPAARELLDALASRGPALMSSPDLAYVGGEHQVREPDAEAWIVRHGLLYPDGWQFLTMPREVALALRGPGWRPAFDPHPPRPPLVPVAPEGVAGEAAAAASALVDRVAAVLGATPIARLKAGGVGAREQRRLARLIAADEPDVRLAVELAYHAGLLAGVADELLPTDRYDAWLADEPGDRLLPLLAAWLALRGVPLADGTALAPEVAGRQAVDVRMVLLGIATDLPEGQALADEEHLLDAVRWRAPAVLRGYQGNEELVRPLWTEASRLGILAHGCLSPLGRALVAMDPDGLALATRALLDRATGTAVFQADLTAVVAGPPSGSLAVLLDGAADRESRGTASVWRFSAGSVRRALDAGSTPDGLLARLREVATGALPQPLEYLVSDVARRHGEVRVRGVGCVLRSADPALLTELLACRALAELRLTALAPTVLASPAKPAEVLSALRSAGYAPVGEDSSGVAQVERVDRRRAKPPGARRPQPEWQQPPEVHPLAAGDACGGGQGQRPPVDPAELASFLLAAPMVATTPPRPVRAEELLERALEHERRLHVVRQPTLEVLNVRAPQLDPEQRRLLADAIDDQRPVRIDYVDGDGRFSSRVIEEIELSGTVIEAWCRLREDERMFLLDRIDSVSPA